MRCILVSTLAITLLLSSFATVIGAEGTRDEGGIHKELLEALDDSIGILRRGGGASERLSRARDNYNNLVGPYRGENFDNSSELIALDNRIDNTFAVFIAQSENVRDENIRALRSDVSLMASKLGIGLSPIYEYALFVILAIGVLVAFLITLVTRRVVNWERVRQIKAEVSAFQKELREAQSKRDMKRVHKLQQDQKRILSLHGEMMRENFKPMIFYLVPYFIFWVILAGVYGGWVVAWLPFRLDLPFFGPWASCGFLSWYLITYFGFSQVWRKLLIRD